MRIVVGSQCLELLVLDQALHVKGQTNRLFWLAP